MVEPGGTVTAGMRTAAICVALLALTVVPLMVLVPPVSWLSSALAAGDPPVIVRDHEVEHGLFYLDPCNLHDGEAEIVADQIERTLAAIRGKPGPALEELRERGYRRMLAWPD